MAEKTLWTYRDAVDQLLDLADASESPRTLRNAKRAVIEAYRKVTQANKWAYYERQGRFSTVAQQTTGTVVYTHSSRTVTLTGATWPDDVIDYRIVINDRHYDIDTRTSSTAIVLSTIANPGADVSSTTYVLYKARYPLPVNFRQMVEFIDLTQDFPLPMKSTTQQVYSYLTDEVTPDQPLAYAVTNTGELLNQMSVEMIPPPDIARDYVFLYVAAPRDLRLFEYSAGTVAGTATESTVTITGGSLPLGCEGSVMRLSASSTKPTSPVGRFTDSLDNPYQEQRVIVSRDSATTATLDAPLGYTYSGAGYTISDPLDVDYDVMGSAVLRMAEAMFAKDQNWGDRNERLAYAVRELSDAKALDYRQTKYAPKFGQHTWDDRHYRQTEPEKP